MILVRMRAVPIAIQFKLRRGAHASIAIGVLMMPLPRSHHARESPPRSHRVVATCEQYVDVEQRLYNIVECVSRRFADDVCARQTRGFSEDTASITVAASAHLQSYNCWHCADEMERTQP